VFVSRSPAESPSTTDAQPPNFECSVSRSERSAAWIRLGGELDIVSAPQLRETLEDAVEHQRLIVVDLRGLTFMDSTGLLTIVDADTAARRRGRKLVLIRGSDQIARLLELAGIADRMEIVDLRYP
jgi:anti-sigma B factor antagonist